MSSSPDDRRRKTGRRPWLRLDECFVEKAADDDGGGYAVKIVGVNLRGAISPPLISIGGQPLRTMKFAPDGRTVTGTLEKPPDGEVVVVDYGFMRAELDPNEERKQDHGEEKETEGKA